MPKHTIVGLTKDELVEISNIEKVKEELKNCQIDLADRNDLLKSQRNIIQKALKEAETESNNARKIKEELEKCQSDLVASNHMLEMGRTAVQTALATADTESYKETCEYRFLKYVLKLLGVDNDFH